MPRFRAPAISALIALLGLALPVEAAPAPIVFDFEDGLQGWSLIGVERRAEPVLGGSYAMFGGEGDRMWIDVDLTNVERITFDALVTGNVDRFVSMWIRGPSYGGVFFFLNAESLLATPEDPTPNPDTRWFDVSTITGLKTVEVRWPRLVRPTLVQPNSGQFLAGFIDDITFHPIPEPGTLALLAVSLAALLIARHRMM